MFYFDKTGVKKQTVVGLIEEIEDGKEDRKILAKLSDESPSIDDPIKQVLIEFTSHVFDHRVGKVMRVGNFYGKKEAPALLEKSQRLYVGSQTL